MRAIFFALFLTLGACSYNVNLRGFDYGSAPFTTLKDKKVVIVDDPAKIQDGHSTFTDGYNYNFAGVRESVTSSLQKRIGMSAAKVDIRTPDQMSAANDFEVFVHPQVKIRTVFDFWTTGCFIEYNLQISNKAGHVLANESGTGKRNFFSAGQAESKCREAMAEVFKAVTDRAVALVSTPLSIPR